MQSNDRGIIRSSLKRLNNWTLNQSQPGYRQRGVINCQKSCRRDLTSNPRLNTGLRLSIFGFNSEHVKIFLPN